LARSQAERQIVDVAARLAGAPVEAIDRVGGGRNSRVFKVETQNGSFALKQYPSPGEDRRDRLGVEAAALTWFEAQGFDVVPRLVAIDRDRNAALLTWIDGALVREVGPADIDQAADFLDRLHRLRGKSSIPATQRDTEACLSGAEVERQIRARVERLSQLPAEPELDQFIAGELAPVINELIGAARAATASKRSFEAELDQRNRSLVPSDFGFHNALRDGRGRLAFIDFEYFGWDDPVKLTADMLLHPGTPLAPDLRARFRNAAERLYADDADFAARLAAFLPLFGLRWVLILLNEFHPERWRNRVLAGATYDWDEAKQRQLAAARRMLQDLTA
jgi:hypothetical protein